MLGLDDDNALWIHRMRVDSPTIQTNGKTPMKMTVECPGKAGLRRESPEFSPVLKPENASTGSAQE